MRACQRSSASRKIGCRVDTKKPVQRAPSDQATGDQDQSKQEPVVRWPPESHAGKKRADENPNCPFNRVYVLSHCCLLGLSPASGPCPAPSRPEGRHWNCLSLTPTHHAAASYRPPTQTPPDYPIRCVSASSSVASGSLSPVTFFHCCSISSFAACSRNSGAAHSCTSKSFLM